MLRVCHQRATEKPYLLRSRALFFDACTWLPTAPRLFIWNLIIQGEAQWNLNFLGLFRRYASNNIDLGTLFADAFTRPIIVLSSIQNIQYPLSSSIPKTPKMDIAAPDQSIMIIRGIRDPSSGGVCYSEHSYWIACFVTGGNSLRYPVKRCWTGHRSIKRWRKGGGR